MLYNIGILISIFNLVPIKDGKKKIGIKSFDVLSSFAIILLKKDFLDKKNSDNFLEAFFGNIRGFSLEHVVDYKILIMMLCRFSF